MSRARELSRLGNTNVITADTSFNVGLGTQVPTNPATSANTQIVSAGIVSAYQLYGDGSALTGVAATDNINTNNIEVSGISTLGTASATTLTATTSVIVGSAVTSNASGINVTGVVTATSFDGDGSALTGLPAGLGTALATSGAGANIYYTNEVLAIDSNLTTDIPSTSDLGYTQYQELAVGSGAELTVADGDQLLVDVLGLTTSVGASILTGSGGVVRANNFTNRTGGAPGFPDGINVTAGVGTFAGITKVTNTTASTSTTTGALVVSGGVGIAGSLHVGENVSVGGTLTYEDVTNIDSVGVVTARLGVIVDAGRGLQVTAGGVNVDAGIGTFDAGVTVGDGARLLVGHTSSDDRDGYQSTLQISGTGGDDSSASIGRWSADASSPGLVLSKSRNGTVGSHSVVQAGDTLGVVQFQGDDGTNYHVGSKISTVVATGVGNDDMPADLIFETNSGSTSTTERLRLTSQGGVHLANGDLIERCKISSTALNSDQVCNLDDGMVHYRTSNLGGSGGTTVILTSAVGLATAMATGDMMSFTLIHATNTTGNYVDHINIDHIVITENWVGGSAPSAGGGSGVDIYTFNIIKKASGTGDTGFTVIGNHIKTS